MLKLYPKAVLAEAGIEVDDAVDVEVVEDSAQKVYLTLPLPPFAERVADDEMDPLLRMQGKSVCSKSNSCCCAHPDVFHEFLTNAPV